MIATLPRAKSWPRECQHRYATEWFVKALEMGKPYNLADWPLANLSSDSLPPHLGLIPAVTRDFPHPEPHVSAYGTQKSERLTALGNALRTWEHNRRLYPGWMIAPERVRRILWTCTTPWVPEISALLPDLTPLGRLQALSELVWRLNKCLFSLPSDFEEAAFDALDVVEVSPVYDTAEITALAAATIVWEYLALIALSQ
jgi:hypothetical protein